MEDSVTLPVKLINKMVQYICLEDGNGEFKDLQSQIVDELYKYTSGNEKADLQKSASSDISIKFGRGFVRKSFSSHNQIYAEICIPNENVSDLSPWETFVLPEKQLHEAQNGKSIYAYIPKDGHTTLHKSIPTGGKLENGKNKYVVQSRIISNVELKKLVEAYKQQNRDSVTEKLDHARETKEYSDHGKEPSEPAHKSNYHMPERE